MEIFNQTTFTESDFEEILLILEDEGTNIWESIPVSFVENLFKQEHQFLASKIFCTLVSTPGSSAFGVTSDIQVIRTFLSCLRKFATPGENNTTNSKKKRKSNPSDEWELFFRTVMILNEQLELSEIANVLISIGCFVNSYDAIRFISDESFTEKKKIYFLKFLLTEISKIVKENELTKEKSSWLSSCLLGLIGNNSDHLFAFLQRLILSCEISTQTNRQKAIDFISTNISNADEEFVQRIIKFSLSSLMNNEKSSKRTFGCELIANLTMQPYPELIQSLSIRTRDTIPSVRCAALRGITILCNKNSFLLLDEDESLLKAAIEIVSKDDKPVVRRWGLKVLSFLPSYNEQAVLVCTERCRDVSISVKKAALETLGCFVSRYPSSAGWAWRYGILPSLRDEEKSVSDSALLTVRKILFAKNNDDHIWTLLYSIRSESDLDCLSMAFKHEKKDEIVFKDFVSSIVERAAMSLPSPDSVSRREILWGAWLILDECRDHLPGPKILSGNFILDAWDSVKGLLSLDEDESNFVGVFEVHALQRRVLRVLGKIISRIPLEKQIELGNELLNDLSNLERPPEVVSEMLLTLYSLCEGKRETVIEWGLYLKQLCEDVLANGEKESILRIDCALFLLGELCMLGFNPDNNEDKLIRFETEETVTTLIQAMIMNISSSTRSFAILSLGKLCLRDSVLAKRCAVIFVKELSEDSNESVRCNSLIVIGDLCRRFTNIVESHMEKISKYGFSDQSPLVRKRCLLTLGGLVQEDYVKLRPMLFYKFLACLSDEEEDIASASQFVLTNMLTKNPTIFHSNACGMLFAFGGLPYGQVVSYHEGENENEFGLSGIQKKFILKNQVNREQIYRFVFYKLDDAQKLEVLNKIRREILGGLLDGTIRLEEFDLENGSNPITVVVSDAFHLLQSDYARPNGKSNNNEELEDENDDIMNHGGPSNNSAIQRATAKIIDTLERKNVQENVIPMIVSLHQICSRERSSLSKLVFEYLKYLVDKYETECSAALAPYREINSMLSLEMKKPKKSITTTTKKMMEEEKKVKTPKLLRKVRSTMLRGV